MVQFHEKLPAKLYEIIERCGISTTSQILTMSYWDIQKLSNLKFDDITILKKVAAECSLISEVLTGQNLMSRQKITTGSKQLNSILKGGFLCGSITEIYGESGSGKTQLCMYTSIHNWQNGVVYICTEDLFPIKRFEQIKKSLPDYKPNINFGQKIFVEHITESFDLISCVKVRLPKLLSKHKPALIIVDSIAAPFRSDSTNYIQRATDLKEVAVILMNVAKAHNLAIVCINQVSSSMENVNVQLIPSLGLVWSNMVSTRICIKNTNVYINEKDIEDNYYLKKEMSSVKVQLRELSIIFSPYLKYQKSRFIITSAGVNFL